MTITKTATAATLYSFMDCIDSSTCIAVRNDNLNEFARFNSSNFFGSLDTYETLTFSQTQSVSYTGLRCFLTVQRCVALGNSFAFYFDYSQAINNVGQRIEDFTAGDIRFALAGCTPDGLMIVSQLDLRVPTSFTVNMHTMSVSNPTPSGVVHSFS